MYRCRNRHGLLFSLELNYEPGKRQVRREACYNRSMEDSSIRTSGPAWLQGLVAPLLCRGSLQGEALNFPPTHLINVNEEIPSQTGNKCRMEADTDDSPLYHNLVQRQNPFLAYTILETGLPRLEQIVLENLDSDRSGS